MIITHLINNFSKSLRNPIKAINTLNRRYLWGAVMWLQIEYKKLQLRDAIIEKSCQLDCSTKINASGCGKGIHFGAQSIIGVRPYNYIVSKWCSCKISQRQPGAIIKVGQRTRLNGVCISAQQKVIIGDDCQIACGVSIMDYNAHKTYFAPRGVKPDYPNPVYIGNNVWIGINAIILKGTSIGDNSVVGAGAVVKGTFPPYSLIIGNPAQLAKTLDKEKFQSE